MIARSNLDESKTRAFGVVPSFEATSEKIFADPKHKGLLLQYIDRSGLWRTRSAGGALEIQSRRLCDFDACAAAGPHQLQDRQTAIRHGGHVGASQSRRRFTRVFSHRRSPSQTRVLGVFQGQRPQARAFYLNPHRLRIETTLNTTTTHTQVKSLVRELEDQQQEPAKSPPSSPEHSRRLSLRASQQSLRPASGPTTPGGAAPSSPASNTHKYS